MFGPQPIYLFSISFLSLFLELLLIRWLSIEIRIFAYFRNLILVSCFIGLGIGFSLKRFKIGILTSVILIALLVALVHPSAEVTGVSLKKISEYLTFSDFHFWYSISSKSTLLNLILGFSLLIPVVILLVTIFIPFGQLLGEIFEFSDNRIRDYSINLTGSLLGTWTFVGLSYLNSPPWIWFLIALVGMVATIRSEPRKRIIGLLAVIPVLLLSLEKDTELESFYWSPYQKLSLKNCVANFDNIEKIPYGVININSVMYMYILDLSHQQADMYPRIFDRELIPYYPYNLPYRFKSEPEHVLIVGAGAGNDVAAALRNGAKQIDAVEIDPVILKLGLIRHPEEPYKDPKVTVVVDDARSFFKKTENRYDIILFSLLDSHTLTSNFTNINLDSYVYTRKSIEEAKSLLKEEGVLALSFQIERDWIGGKLYSNLKEVFEDHPLVISNLGAHFIQGTGSALFLCGNRELIDKRIDSDSRLKDYLKHRMLDEGLIKKELLSTKFDVPTDDWPYLYIQNRKVPILFIILTIIIVCLIYCAVRVLMPGGRIGPCHFFFLGAGFLLVEVYSISKIALLFGSTWIVNVVMISSILIMILLANIVALRFKIERLRWWYMGIFLSLTLSYLVPIQELFLGGYIVRGLLAGAFYSAPLFFAGVIFASSIKKVESVESAFAANMFGSAIGGMMESTSFLFGLKAVILVAILLYIASALALKRMPIRE